MLDDKDKIILGSFGNENLSVINNPFNKNKIKRIYVSFSKSSWTSDNGKWFANGSIEFQNGNTSGEQKFDGETFDDVVLQMKAVINQLMNE